MSKYTITLKEILETGFKLFDFDYPMKPEEHKPVFEELFIRHFYFREIGTETPYRFKYHLETELKKLLPHYNKLYMSQSLEQRILDNYDVTEEFTRDTKNTSKQDEIIKGISISNQTNEAENLNQFSDTPVSRVNIGSSDFISSMSKDNSNGSTNVNNNIDNKVDRTSNDNLNENWKRTMKGNIGIQTDADAVMKYESSLKNVDMLLLGELENLFMGVF